MVAVIVDKDSPSLQQTGAGSLLLGAEMDYD
jgi:hypothetical protein